MRRCLLLVTLAALAACGGDDDPLHVQTAEGTLQGKNLGDGVRAFLGVPYAAPPTGANRWRPPQPVAPWSDIRDARMIGSQCPQSLGFSGPGGDEDCLFLNVWTPPSPPPQGAPVFVWIHGGAFVFGAGGDPFYDGDALAAKLGVVVVTLNYRLGALGFLAHQALDHEDPAYASSGNYGIEDQYAALQWVHRNIAAFSGDPAHVVLAGESAGGYSVCMHYAAARTADLFQTAISESGVCGAMLTPHELANASGGRIATQLGCTGMADADTLTCLRGKSTDELLATVTVPISSQVPGGPLYDPTTPLMWPNDDGLAYTGALADALAAPPAPRPLLLGTNHDEGTLFVSSIFAKPISTEPEYEAALAVRYGTANVAAIVQKYPVASFASANAALAAVTGDGLFVCPARRTARAIALTGAPVFRYTFQKALEGPLLPDAGVPHASEVAFVFGNDDFPLGMVGASGADLSATMQRYWTRFGNNGDPNGEGDPVWPSYGVRADPYQVLDAPISSAAGLESDSCDFWDKLSITL